MPFNSAIDRTGIVTIICIRVRGVTCMSQRVAIESKKTVEILKVQVNFMLWKCLNVLVIGIHLELSGAKII